MPGHKKGREMVDMGSSSKLNMKRVTERPSLVSIIKKHIVQLLIHVQAIQFYRHWGSVA
jgi:hypothetical protein